MGSVFLATGNGNMTPAYLAAARCVAELMPGPARAPLTLLRRTGTVHDFRTPPRGVSAKMSTEKLSFRGCGTYSKKLASSLHPQPTGAPSSGPDRDSINSIHGAFYSCKRPYGGYATSYLLAVLIYTQIATSASAWSRSNMNRTKESSANAILSTIIPISKLESLL